MRSGSAMISMTGIRGSSDAYGSWKTICISRRSGRIWPRRQRGQVLVRVVDRAGRSAGLRLSSARPVVDLPQPDSPTSAEGLVARQMSKETSQTACTSPTWRRIRPRDRTGKCLTRPRTDRTGCRSSTRRPRCAASVGGRRPRSRGGCASSVSVAGGDREDVARRAAVDDLRAEVAGGAVLGARPSPGAGRARPPRRRRCASGQRGRERAAGRQVEQRRRGARDRGEPLAVGCVDARQAAEQAERVRHPRAVEDVVDRAGLDRAARRTSPDPVGVPGDHAEVVGDQHHARRRSPPAPPRAPRAPAPARSRRAPSSARRR